MKKRSQASKAETSVSPPEPKKLSSDKVTFETFFSKCVNEGLLKEWQRLEIAVFFRDMNLREKEDLEVFEAMLRKY